MPAEGWGVNFNSIRAVVADGDGVLWRGDAPLPGVAAFFQFLQGKGLPLFVVTNSSTSTEAEYLAKLKRFGASLPSGNIVTSARATAAYLEGRALGSASAYVIGQPSLTAALQEAGLRLLTDASEAANYLVVGGDPDLTYVKLKEGVLQLQRGATFIGTNPDLLYPTEEGLVPECGTILAALEAATGVVPTVIGKPAPYLFGRALERAGTRPSQTLMLGDRMDTDIVGAQRCGMKAALLETGVDEGLAVGEKGVEPDASFKDLEEIRHAWQKQEAGA